MDSYEGFNMRNQLDAETFVDNNFLRLCQLYNVDDESSHEEKRQNLIDYFSKHPEAIKNYGAKFFGNRNTMNIPLTNNIGGVIKYH